MKPWDLDFVWFFFFLIFVYVVRMAKGSNNLINPSTTIPTLTLAKLP